VTPLTSAASLGNVEVASALLDNGLDINARDHEYKGTALHYAAAFGGTIPMVEFLLARGAEINARDGVMQGTPLHWAAMTGRAKWSSSLPRRQRI
jgi:ankyrin repeat protein